MMELRQLYRNLRVDLSDIEKGLEHAVHSDSLELRNASLHLLKAGGKRIRPVFVLLSGQFGHAKTDKIKDAAVALELLHMASLVHDDVVDDAELRRGRPTIKSKWDNRVAVYTGDFMFSSALSVIAEIGHPGIHQVLSKVMVEMTLGEIEQIHDLFNWHQNLRYYLRRVKRKTALLIAVSCRVGAVAAGTTDEISMALYRFGYYVGMSYQMMDDILDFSEDEKQIGKPVGNDLKQGNVTLPVLYALRNENCRGEIISFLRAKSFDEAAWQHAIRLVIESGALEEAHKLSARYLEKGSDILASMPESKAKNHLYQVIDYFGRRKA